VTRVAPVFTGAPIRLRVGRTASVRVRVKGRQAIPRFVTGTLLIQCRLHKTVKETHLCKRAKEGKAVGEKTQT
jgi:hypothetical protein